MPVSCTVEGAVLVVRMAGDYATAELRDAIARALDDPARPPLAGMLFDLRDSRSLERRTAGDVHDMARFLGRQSARYGRRLAMVAPSDLAYGLMRMGAVLAEEGGAAPAVFRTAEAARAWLRGDAGAG